jgi:hypothetical protein
MYSAFVDVVFVYIFSHYRQEGKAVKLVVTLYVLGNG